MLSKTQENIIKLLVLPNLKAITDNMPKGYTELKVASEIVTLARKNKIDKGLAKRIVKGMPLEKFIDMPLGGELKGQMPMKNEKVISTKI